MYKRQPVPYRYLYHNYHIPHTFELVFQAVENRGIGYHIIPHQCDGWKMLRTGYIYFLFINLRCQFEATYLPIRQQVVAEVVTGCQEFLYIAGQERSRISGMLRCFMFCFRFFRFQLFINVPFRTYRNAK